MESKLTAVEWLLQRFESGDMYNVEDAQFIKFKAKEMEKEQIIDIVEKSRQTGLTAEYLLLTYGKETDRS